MKDKRPPSKISRRDIAGDEFTPANKSAQEDEEYQQKVSQDLQRAGSELRALEGGAPQAADSWSVAGSLIARFRPIPLVVWRIVRAVYGRSGRITQAHPLTFIGLERVLYRAAVDETLAVTTLDDILSRVEQSESAAMRDVVETLGIDVAAALCLIHAVCRRVAQSPLEPIWRPILDDALLRAQIGFHLGGFIDGFTTALLKMHPGDHWQVFIPYQLAYGASGNSSIQGYSMLRFEMVLKSYKRASGKKWITK